MKSKATMRASVLYEAGRLEVRDVPFPRLGSRDVLVRVTAVGICGTDLHIFSGEANYNTDQRGERIPLAAQPQILGHEIVGVVEDTGREVHDLRPGARVVLDQGRNCASAAREPLCEYCATGDSHQCAFYAEHGITGLQGGLAEYIAIPAVNAVEITGSLDPALAALTEPLGCIVHSSDLAARARSRYRVPSEPRTASAARCDEGRNAVAADAADRVQGVLIFGAGPAGLLFTQYLRSVLGYDGVLIVAEPNEKKRGLAKSFGAEVVDPTVTDLAEAVLDLTHGRRVEYLIEASGSGRAMQKIPQLIRKQATVLLYGHGHGGVDLSILNNLLFLEPVLIASVGASGGLGPDGRPLTYARSLSLIQDGTIQVAPAITHRYTSLEMTPQAFGGAHRASDYVKGVVVM